MPKKFAVSFFAMVASAFAPGLVHAATMTIYQDNFGRVGSLSGSSPSPIDATSATYTSKVFTTDGTSAVGSGGAEAYLPLTLGKQTYTLSETITPTANAGDSDWLAFGFTGATNFGGEFTPDANPQLWLLYREDGGTQYFYDGNTS
jgi:hypothetical protein